MKDNLLTQLKAEAMSPEQIAAEISRIDHAVTKAARPREVGRYAKRREIFAAELVKRFPVKA
jgi:hypothetical protein